MDNITEQGGLESSEVTGFDDGLESAVHEVLGDYPDCKLSQEDILAKLRIEDGEPVVISRRQIPSNENTQYKGTTYFDVTSLVSRPVVVEGAQQKAGALFLRQTDTYLHHDESGEVWMQRPDGSIVRVSSAGTTKANELANDFESAGFRRLTDGRQGTISIANEKALRSVGIKVDYHMTGSDFEELRWEEVYRDYPDE